MQLGIRIKASEDYADIQALAFVGGEFKDGPYPKFTFSNGSQRRSYEEIRKRIKGGESIESIARSYQVSGGITGVPEKTSEAREHGRSTADKQQS
ncbi:hypothetical protein [Paenibacillus rhizosphaerae]|uniref:hypothetical protein n=1 Tax=Paenibacillus rhizosphaerae TaxID=297318 RepID=UPI00117DC8DC|nr:hypothetical protein [Paenibacillus rhizosphaerae]